MKTFCNSYLKLVFNPANSHSEINRDDKLIHEQLKQVCLQSLIFAEQFVFTSSRLKQYSGFVLSEVLGYLYPYFLLFCKVPLKFTLSPILLLLVVQNSTSLLEQTIRILMWEVLFIESEVY